jgi:hypothetical protein
MEVFQNVLDVTLEIMIWVVMSRSLGMSQLSGEYALWNLTHTFFWWNLINTFGESQILSSLEKRRHK